MIGLTSARFIGLPRRAGRPAVLRLVRFEPLSSARFNGLVPGFSHCSRSWGLKPELKNAKAPCVPVCSATSRKTAGLLALRGSPMNRAEEALNHCVQLLPSGGCSQQK
jgi:hypothetical protein